ncbi:hypothetical protein JD276_14260 [Leucobacter sp. CSA1]|uniref:Uncharacterized protein n=1 Tax=Leucobacter chromiisoli TaxID=2796471 RepID=A0A934QAJ4_9MICO|nr:hypothetical protein [Leucobacter chromiisoli]MBK0420196.1 hypothetical protein [Leucobacter chromiisoli]
MTMDRRDATPATPGPDVETPEADLAEQRLVADPAADDRGGDAEGAAGDPPELVNEADWIEQQIDVPHDDEDRGEAEA